jgi:alpha-1,6-mannosyltransferase
MRPAALPLCGAVLSLCVLAWCRQGDATGRVASHLALYGLAFAAYLGGLRSAEGLPRRGLVLALGLAVLWRAALVLAPPLLSNDINRYVWEGRVQVHGGNPYAWPDRPDAPRWEGLRDEVWRGLNHADYPAIYPPLWQLAAWAVVALRDSVTAMKAFLVFSELLMLWPLALVLKRRGLPPERLLVLAWSPLALVEIAGSGHNEAFGMLFLVLALAALEYGHPLASAVAAALGLQAKFLPGLVALAWGRRYRPGQLLLAAVVALLLLLPYASAGHVFWLSLSKYASFWRFNETLFAALLALLGSHRAAAVTAAALAVALSVALAAARTEPVAAGTLVVAASLLLGPNVLPWYALWFLPFLVVRPEPAALLFTGTVALAYLVYPAWQSGERWEVGWGIRAFEYGPCLAVAVMAARAPRPVP